MHTLQRAFIKYTQCCVPFFAARWAGAQCVRGKETPLAQTWVFVIHCPVVFAGGLRAGSHLILGQNMAHNV